jgi:hypothetical protein
MQKKHLLIFTALFFIFSEGEAHMMHQTKINSEWREESVDPFDELMVSWNAARPKEGKYLIYVSAKVDDWSPWLLYGSWGSDGQSSFSQDAPQAKVYQDALEIKEGKKASGFQIKIECMGDASLDQVYGIHVYTNSDRKKEMEMPRIDLESVYLPVEGLSQMAVDHPRHADLCSPTSTTAVVNYLSGKNSVRPVDFARSIWDGGFDIFGNWVFNVAEAAHLLGPNHSAWVERLSGFDAIHKQLKMGMPVVVSVRGPLPGSALPYAKGHLLAVIGFDAHRHKVYCMDPAFPSDKETLVAYEFSDFLEAWNRRGRIAYMFSKS